MAVYRIFLLILLALGPALARPHKALSQSAPTASTSAGRDRFTLTLGGTAQIRASYAHDAPLSADRLGFGIRRLRLRLKTSLGERFAFFVQGEGAGSGLSILGFSVEYRLSPLLSLRAGRIVSALPAAMTGHTHIDAIDRTVGVGEWAHRTIGADAHDFGLEARLTLPRLQLQAFLHNGDGNWSRARGNFREDVGVGGATQGIDRTGLAATLAVAYTPSLVRNLEVGGILGVNGSRNPNTAYQEVGRAYTTYSVHCYWGALPGSLPLRLKADFLAVQYETLPAEGGTYRQHMQGLSLLAAGRLLPASEVFVRYETFTPNRDQAEARHAFLTLGASFSPSALRGLSYDRERITLAWTSRLGSTAQAPSYGLVLQVQVVF